MQNGNSSETQEKNHNLIQKIYQNDKSKSEIKDIESNSLNQENPNDEKTENYFSEMNQINQKLNFKDLIAKS